MSVSFGLGCVIVGTHFMKSVQVVMDDDMCLAGVAWFAGIFRICRISKMLKQDY